MGTTERIRRIAQLSDDELYKQCLCAIRDYRQWPSDPIRNRQYDDYRFACMDSKRVAIWQKAYDAWKHEMSAIWGSH